MPKTIETTVYQFDELTDEAKEKARDWYRSGALDYVWWDSVYENAANAADKLGITLRTKLVKLMNGGTRQEPCIWFSGFCSQGDGACFEGDYCYRKNSVKELMAEWPKDEKLHAIAKGLQDVQRRNFYKITAVVTHRDRYCHEHSVDIDVTVDDRDYDKDTDDTVAECLRDFMRWIYESLEAEHDWRLSDECVDEDITANEYEFTEDGHRA